MSRRDMFLEFSHPLDATFSHRDYPCRLDSTSRQSSVPEPECYFQKYCEQFDGNHYTSVVYLRRAYLNWIKVTLSEPTSSIIIRSEHQYHQNNQVRYALRKHLYEYVGRQAGTEMLADSTLLKGLACAAISTDDRFRRYIGFVDLRVSGDPPDSNGITFPIALGLLVIPSWIEQNTKWQVITGNYGTFFGAHSFSSTVFCTHDPNFGGAACAQMCLIMVLVTLSDRGAIIEGSYTITYMAAELQENKVGEQNISREHLEPAQRKQRYSFVARGLYPIDCETLLQEKLNVSAFLSSNLCSSPSSGESQEQDGSRLRLLKALLEAYIRARFPVILFVKPPDTEREEVVTVGHAISLIGIEVQPDIESCSLMYHDPAGAPFLTKRFLDVIRDSINYPLEKTEGEPLKVTKHQGLNPLILFCSDVSVTCQIAHFVELLLKYLEKISRNYSGLSHGE